MVKRLRVQPGCERRDELLLGLGRLGTVASHSERVVERGMDLAAGPAQAQLLRWLASLLHVADLRHRGEDEAHAYPRPHEQPQAKQRRLRHPHQQRVEQHEEGRQDRKPEGGFGNGGWDWCDVDVIVGRWLLSQRAQRLQYRRAERGEASLPHERPPLIKG